MTDWATIASFATTGETLVLAVATFSAVRTSNRSARISEQALQQQRRPVLQARLEDPAQKIRSADGYQRTISRLGVTPAGEDRRIGTVTRHWDLDFRLFALKWGA